MIGQCRLACLLFEAYSEVLASKCCLKVNVVLHFHKKRRLYHETETDSTNHYVYQNILAAYHSNALILKRSAREMQVAPQCYEDYTVLPVLRLNNLVISLRPQQPTQ